MQCIKQGAEFGVGFGQFLPGVGVGDDAGAGMQFYASALDQRRAQGDREIAIACAVEYADAAAVG